MLRRLSVSTAFGEVGPPASDRAQLAGSSAGLRAAGRQVDDAASGHERRGDPDDRATRAIGEGLEPGVQDGERDVQVVNDLGAADDQHAPP